MRIIRRFGAVAAFLLVTLGFSLGQQRTAAGEDLRFKCDTPGVSLEGTLTERTFFGPPGFGETPQKDVREKVLILKLAQPITVEPTSDAAAKNSASLTTIKNVREVQLFVERAQTAAIRKLLGKTVIAVGTLNEAVAPSEHLDVSMHVKTISPK